MENFEQFGLPTSLVDSLERMQIKIPTPIQTATIPLALDGHDILASAQTGSGKTVAYSIPLIIKLLSIQKSSAIILTPTRELALQVQQTLNKLLLQNNQFKTVLLIGGTSMFKQIAALRKRPQLIVGTPGRINDHLQRGSLILKETRFLVIDEADRMLDMGFGIQLDKIAEYLPENRQTLMFSATLPPNIERLSKRYLRAPQRISIDTSLQPAPKINHEIRKVKNAEKFSLLLKELETRQGSIIIFVKTKHGTERLSAELQKQGHISDAIHGDLRQRVRERVIYSFRNCKTRILVATDVAARGLDIPHVMHVINYDLPQCPEDYVHRIGRTARAGAEGNAVCFIAPEDHGKWKEIYKLMNPAEAKAAAEMEKSLSDRPLFKEIKPPKKSSRYFSPRRFKSKRSR